MDPVEALDDLWTQLRAVPRAARGDRGARRAAGVFFTPAPLAAHVARAVLAPLLAGWSGGTPRLRILDPAAGDGSFLAAALDVLAAAAPGVPRATLARRCLIGLERDPALAQLARARTGAIVHECEALLDAPSEVSGVDAIVGNPPYVRSIRLRRADPALWQALRGRFAATSHGEWDLYGAFVERCLDWLAPGGRAGLVVPSRWLTARFAARLRGKLAAAGAVRAIVDFGAAQVFPDATTYASVLVLERVAAASSSPAAVAPSRAIDVARLDARGWRSGHVAASSLGEAPWVLAVGDDARLRARLSARGPSLGEVARIVKGAGTNADPVFVLDDCTIDGARVRAGAIDVERAATVPCLRGRDVAAFAALAEDAPHPRCVYPYRDGALIPLVDFRRAHPRAGAHLDRHRAILEAREDRRFAGDAFHCFGRPQNLAFHLDRAPKVVVPDVARAGRAMVDDRGALVLDSAYAIRPRDAGWDPWLLALVLSSPIVALWLRVAGVPLRGGYLRLKTEYLAPLPLPPPSPHRDRATALAHRCAAVPTDRRAVDDADLAEALEHLRLAYDIDRDPWSS